MAKSPAERQRAHRRRVRLGLTLVKIEANEGGEAGPKETARLGLEADGTVSVYVGSTAVGQGLETVMAQALVDQEPGRHEAEAIR